MMPFRNMAKIRRLLNMIKILWRLGLEQFYVQTWCNFRNKAQFFSSLKKKNVSGLYQVLILYQKLSCTQE